MNIELVSPSYCLRYDKIELYPTQGKYFILELSLVNEIGRLIENIDQNNLINTTSTTSITTTTTTITSTNKNTNKRRNYINIQINLINLKNENEYCNELMEIKGNQRIENNGKCKLEVKLLGLSLSYGNLPFVFVSSICDSSIQSQRNIKYYFSQHMFVVRYHLRLSESSNLPQIWYRDLPGKFNSIKIQLFLKTYEGETVLGRNISLLIKLMYSESEEEVYDQSILKLLSNKSVILNKHGICDIDCMISQISKKHNNHHFTFYITPNILKDPSCGDISPIKCGYIEVRSKPSHKILKDIKSNSKEQSRNNLRKNEEKQETENDEEDDVEIESIQEDKKSNQMEEIEEENFYSKKRKMTSSFFDSSNNIEYGKESTLDSQDINRMKTTINRLKSTNKELIQWFDSIVKLIPKLKWNPISTEVIPYYQTKYEETLPSLSTPTTTTSKKSTNLKNDLIYISRPIYEIVNPNEVIDQIICSYQKMVTSKYMSDLIESHIKEEFYQQLQKRQEREEQEREEREQQEQEREEIEKEIENYHKEEEEEKQENSNIESILNLATRFSSTNQSTSSTISSSHSSLYHLPAIEEVDLKIYQPNQNTGSFSPLFSLSPPILSTSSNIVSDDIKPSILSFDEYLNQQQHF